MSVLVRILVWAVLPSLCTAVYAQDTISAAALLGAPQQRKTVPAGTVGTLSLKLSPSGGGGRIRVAYTDPAVTITLVPPGGPAVIAANAESLGFEWTHVTMNDVEGDLLQIIGLEGEQLLIDLPETAPDGIYTIRADARKAKTSAIVLMRGDIPSGLLVKLNTERDEYRLSEPVVLTATVADDAGRLLHPAMTLEVSRVAWIPSGLAIRRITLVRSKALRQGGYRHYFTASLMSRNVTEGAVSATLDNSDGQVNLARECLRFSAVRAGMTATTRDLIAVDTESKAPPATAGWRWRFDVVDPPESIAMRDETADQQGVYTVRFHPTKTGQYSVQLTAKGQRSSGADYVDGADTSFRVVDGRSDGAAR